MTQEHGQSGPPGTSVIQEDDRVFISSHTPIVTRIYIGRFMLPTPKPAQPRPDSEDTIDIEMAQQALAESDERIPYDEVRRELGLQ